MNTATSIATLTVPPCKTVENDPENEGDDQRRLSSRARSFVPSPTHARDQHVGKEERQCSRKEPQRGKAAHLGEVNRLIHELVRDCGDQHACPEPHDEAQRPLADGHPRRDQPADDQ
jgi:hypothetical protein